MSDNQLAIASPQRSAAASTLVMTWTDMQQMAQAVADSGLFAVKDKNRALMLLLLAQGEGLHPIIAARDYDIIQNKPSLKSAAMLSRHLGMGGTIEWHESTDTVADVTVRYRGAELRVKWTMQTAREQGLADKDNYKKQPRVMLRWRAVTEGIRAVNPQSTHGLYTVEENQDIVPEVRYVQNTSAIEPSAILPPAHDVIADNTPQDWSIGESIALLTADDDARVLLHEQADKLAEVYGATAVSDALQGAANMKLEKNGPVLTEKTVTKAVEGLRSKLEKQVQKIEGVTA